jgi:hypothetical protein
MTAEDEGRRYKDEKDSEMRLKRYGLSAAGLKNLMPRVEP